MSGVVPHCPVCGQRVDMGGQRNRSLCGRCLSLYRHWMQYVGLTLVGFIDCSLADGGRQILRTQYLVGIFPVLSSSHRSMKGISFGSNLDNYIH